MNNKLSFIWRVIKTNKKGRFFIIPFLLSFFLDKIFYFLSLRYFESNLKKRVYKAYLKYRLRK
tara:strand:- start:1910 stop:2098 length:189 start_codon:yes stop_codon:yes gene_type:complete